MSQKNDPFLGGQSLDDAETTPKTKQTVAATLLSEEVFSDLLISSKRRYEDRFTAYSNMTINSVYGPKTISEWGDYCEIKISKEPTTEELMEAGAKLVGIHAAILTCLEQARAVNFTLQQQYDASKNDLFVKIKRQTKGYGLRGPSNDLASSTVASNKEMMALKIQLRMSDFIVSFWENKQFYLIALRKTLEMMSFSRNAEMKATQFAI